MNFVSSRLWTIDHWAFEEICGSGECASADGFLLESGTADSFGMRYVEEGFDWIDARDIGRRDGWVRFEKDTQGRLTSRSIDRPIAAYSVVDSYEQPNPSTHLSVTTVLERGSGKQLAPAGSATFDGGCAK